jgi:aspartyl-tRNA(Asn)/glutamyl-tRNA(Gln) amidotransferase subunit B
MELVTEPDVKNAEEAVAFAKELQLILRYLGISEADMEKGQMRVEANISLDMGTKVEVKNINSFRAVYGAIEYEIKRQNGVLDEGGKIHQETRGWDDQNNRTVSQRSKESAHDYRYFPEPDLPPLELTPQGGFDVEDLKRHLPELPEEKRQRLVEEFGFGRDQVDILVGDRAAADYFEAAASELKGDDPKASYQLLLNYFTSDLKGLMNEKKTEIKDLKITPEHLANLVVLVSEGKLSSRLAKDILLKMFEIGDEPGTIMKASGVALMSDEGDLLKVIEEIIAKNPKPVEDYKKGKTNALQFLFGQAMAKTKGQAKPDVLRRILTEKLDA